MAAAASLVDGSTIPAGAKTRGRVQERKRSAVGGAFGGSYLDRKEAAARKKREQGRLDEGERQELLLAWGGFSSASLCRSGQGAVEDRLLRAPPRAGHEVERAVLALLRQRGRGGVARDTVVEVVHREEGCTRYEVRRAMRAMVGRGDVAFFTEERERDAPQPRLLAEPYGMATGPERDGKYASVRETVVVEMVRVAEPGLALQQEEDEDLAALRPAERRWARADRELERSWRVIECGEGSRSLAPRLPPAAPRYSPALSCLRRLEPAQRRVLERAYASALVPAALAEWGRYGEDVARLVPLTDAVEEARWEIVRSRGQSAAARAVADRSTYAADAIRVRLDAPPEGEAEREAWRSAREAFVDRARGEAEKLLADAVKAYREVRAG